MSISTKPAAHAQTLRRARRESAEESLLSFMDQAWHVVEPDRPFLYGWHIQMIAEHLEAVSAGQIKDLVISVPPGCCKSLLVSVFWPCWRWTTKPGTKWLFASYQEELAVRDSMRCRLLLESPWYQERWGNKVKIHPDSNKRARFENLATGWRLATSVGGRGTGEHPDVVGIDDANKVRGAESETERNAVTDWYDGTISTRGIIHQSARVIVQQRVHELDLSGHVLKRGVAEHICLPMEFEPGRMKATVLGWTDPRTTEGELLWPEAFPAGIVQTLKTAMGSYHAASQLQQRPAPRGGGMFKRDWFPIVGAAPAGCRWHRFWDLAATKKRRSDFTASCLIGLCDGVWYVRNMRRERLSPHQIERLLQQTAAVDGLETKIIIEKEPGASGVIVIHNYVTMLAGYSIRGVRPNDLGSKEARADAMSAQAEAGNIRFVSGAWNEMVLDELETFPSGEHDDLCLVAGTSISTARGEIPIESVLAGDRVMTRSGWCEVEWSGQTGSSRSLFELSTSDGRRLVGTGGHRFFSDSGFVRLDAKSGAFNTCLCRITNPNPPSRSSSTESPSTAIRPAGSALTGFISAHTRRISAEELECFIRKSGGPSTGKFHPDESFITRMATRLTTMLTTLRRSLTANTSQSIGSLVATAIRTRSGIWRVSDIWLRNGIGQILGVSGTGSTRLPSLSSAGSWCITASSATRSLSHGPPSARFVPTCAMSATTGNPISSSVNARCAARSFSAPREMRAGTHQSSAPKSVPPLLCGQRGAPVFNLKVRGQPEFFANGILVHNCDTLSGGFMATVSRRGPVSMARITACS